MTPTGTSLAGSGSSDRRSLAVDALAAIDAEASRTRCATAVSPRTTLPGTSTSSSGRPTGAVSTAS